ncbi:MAG: endolytic transglycosylase MltG [Brevundimonas sp.]
MSNSQTEWWAPTEGNGHSADLFGGDPTSEQPRRSRSGGRKRQERQRKQRRRRSFLVVIVAMALVLGSGYVVYSLLSGMAHDGGSPSSQPTDYSGPGFGDTQVTINTGDTGADMAATLTAAGVVASTEAFTDAFAANLDAASIQPGTYTLLQHMSAADAVEALLNPASKDSFRVTIPEGLTAEQIYERISSKMLIPVADVKKAASDEKAIGLPKEANGKVEGWLFPATYEISPDASATDVLKQMTAKTVSVLKDKDVAKADWETVLNKASLVEREAKMDEDRPKIARAIDNRLAQGMRLQINAATAYGAGKPGTKLTTADLEDTENPYNVEVHTGLPPTPIASPGEKSIDAVLNPAEGKWLYWVTVNLDTGETLFAETNEQQNVNRQKLDAWMAEHGDG